MSGPERRVNRFVDDLLRNRKPRRFRVSPEDLEAMRAAVQLRATQTGADLPDPDFVDRLTHRLREELSGETRQRHLSRRGLLTTAGTAAAAVVAGGIAGVVGDRLVSSEGRPSELVPVGARWQPLATAASLPDGHVQRFSTAAVEGFIVNKGGTFQALSAVCTHLGCILQFAGGERLTCPCHRTAFSLGGSVLNHELPQAPQPLPRLRTRVRDGHVEVFTA